MFWICFVPAALLLLGLADLPIGYYTLLRTVVCLASCLLIYKHYDEKGRINLAVGVFGAIALLFNPIIPIYLRERDVWAVIDIIAAIAFVVEYIYLRVTENTA